MCLGSTILVILIRLPNRYMLYLHFFLHFIFWHEYFDRLLYCTLFLPFHFFVIWRILFQQAQADCRHFASQLRRQMELEWKERHHAPTLMDIASFFKCCLVLT